jgi:hypothetical protein
MSRQTVIAPGDIIIAPSTDSSASRFCGGTVCVAWLGLQGCGPRAARCRSSRRAAAVRGGGRRRRRGARRPGRRSRHAPAGLRGARPARAASRARRTSRGSARLSTPSPSSSRAGDDLVVVDPADAVEGVEDELQQVVDVDAACGRDVEVDVDADGCRRRWGRPESPPAPAGSASPRRHGSASACTCGRVRCVACPSGRVTVDGQLEQHAVSHAASPRDRRIAGSCRGAEGSARRSPSGRAVSGCCGRAPSRASGRRAR